MVWGLPATRYAERTARPSRLDSPGRDRVSTVLCPALCSVEKRTPVEGLDAGVDAIEERVALSEVSSSLEGVRLSATRRDPDDDAGAAS